MKKCLILVLCGLASSAFAVDVTVQGKAGYYYPKDNTVRKVYDDGGVIYGGEVGLRFVNYLDLFGDIYYFAKSGSSTGQHYSTRIKIVPVGVGLKGSYPIGSFEVYGAASAKHFNVRINNTSPYVIQHQEKNGWGWGAKVGFSYLIQGFLFDVFVEYMQKKFSFPSGGVDVGGGVLGGAIGYRF